MNNQENFVCTDQDLQKFLKCDVFTPDDIGKLMVSKLHKYGNLLEPSVGCGNLLKHINCDLYDDIDVYEIKKEYMDQIPYHNNIRKHHCDFIKKEIDIQYTNIIMNPPYIKMQDLSVDYRKYIKEKFDVINNGIVDIYYAFILKTLQLLKDDGVLVAITPNSYLYNKSSTQLRKYLFDNRLVKEIINFEDKKVFPNVSVYCCITICTKTPNQNIVYNDKSILYDNINNNNYSLFDFSSSEKQKLSDICKIRNGIATLRDKIYIHDDKIYEEPCWRKIICGNREKYIIYPYENGVVLEESDFCKDNPYTYAYLTSQKDELAKRDKGNKKYPKWYSYGRTQSLKCTTKKCIYIPCFLNPETIDKNITVNQNILHSGCLCIEPKEEKDIEKIIECLICNKTYLSQNCAKRSGGWVSLSSRVLYNLNLQ